MKVKMAQRIDVFLCEECASVHIGLFRDGKMFAEAIPDDPQAVAQLLQKRIAESRERQGAPSPARH